MELYEQFGFDFLSNIWPLTLTATKPTSSPAVKIEPAAVAPKVEVPSVQSIRKVESLSDDEDGDRASGQGDVQPVGHDYVEEVKKKNMTSASRWTNTDPSFCIMIRSWFSFQVFNYFNFCFSSRSVMMMGKWLDFTVNSVNAVLMIPTLKTCTWREEGTDFSTRWDTRHLVNQDHALVAWNNLHTTFTRRRQALHVLLCDPQTNTVHKLPDILSLMIAATGWRQVPIFETIQL